MKMDVLFAGVPVSDFAAAKAWYTSLLGREEDIVAKDDEVMWRIAEVDGCTSWPTRSEPADRWLLCRSPT